MTSCARRAAGRRHSPGRATRTAATACGWCGMPRGPTDPARRGSRCGSCDWVAADALPGSASGAPRGSRRVARRRAGQRRRRRPRCDVAREPLVPPTISRPTGLSSAGCGTRPRRRGPVAGHLGRGGLLRPDPTRGSAAVLGLWDGRREWAPQPDLVGSGRLDTHLVVEAEPGGVSRLRFGDGLSGRARRRTRSPPTGSVGERRARERRTALYA